MSISFDNENLVRGKMSNLFVNTVTGKISDDDEYPEDGYEIKPKDVGLNVIYGVFGVFSTGHIVVYDKSNDKIKAYADASELTNEDTSLQDETVDLMVFGT